MNSQLQSLGIDEDAVEVYRALLDLGTCTRAELSLRLGLSAERTEEALSALAESVLVRLFPGPTDGPGEARIHPVSPKVGLTAAVARRRERLLRAQADVERLEVDVAGLISAHESLTGRKACRGTEWLAGGATAAVRIQELSRTAEREIAVLSPNLTGGAACGLPEAETEAALARGLTIRRVHLRSIRNRPQEHAAAGRHAGAGCRIRTVPMLAAELMVFDRSVAVLPQDPQDPSAGAVVVDHHGIVAGLCLLFERFWQSAEDFGRAPGLDEHGLTAAEQELLQLLADGCTDEAACRRMGVSLRTVRRMTAQLMARLDARSRFQAGATAAARGWL